MRAGVPVFRVGGLDASGQSPCCPIDIISCQWYVPHREGMQSLFTTPLFFSPVWDSIVGENIRDLRCQPHYYLFFFFSMLNVCVIHFCTLLQQHQYHEYCIQVMPHHCHLMCFPPPPAWQKDQDWSLVSRCYLHVHLGQGPGKCC